jgi:hypothetical protein
MYIWGINKISTVNLAYMYIWGINMISTVNISDNDRPDNT